MHAASGPGLALWPSIFWFDLDASHGAALADSPGALSAIKMGDLLFQILPPFDKMLVYLIAELDQLDNRHTANSRHLVLPLGLVVHHLHFHGLF
jgi:hypothetical protein